MINLDKIQKWAGKGKVKKLIKALKSKDSSIVASVLEALGNIGGEDAVNAITSLTESADKTVRSAAITALGKCGTAASETRLKYFLNKETDKDMLEVIRGAIKTYADNHKN
ncbi:MAG: HEAT repeat domain-containing protein [Lachnospiraceae bacterium]|nr:HEAT repeat domain-containing protein [Lachnospiraceae bacterium]